MRDQRFFTGSVLALAVAALVLFLGRPPTLPISDFGLRISDLALGEAHPAIRNPQSAMEWSAVARSAPAVGNALASDAARSCWIGPGTWIPWPQGMDTASLQLVYNSRAEEFVALGLQHWIETDEETGEITGEGDALVGLRLSPTGQPLGEPTTIISDTLSTYPALAYSPARDRYLLVWGVYQSLSSGGGSRLMTQMLAPDLTPVGQPAGLGVTTGYPRPVIAYNPDDDEFLVGWTDAQPGPPIPMTPIPQPTPFPTPTPVPGTVQSVLVQRVSSDGTPLGSPVLLATKVVPPGGIELSQVAYNRGDREYLVLWERSEPGRHETYTQRLSHTGEFLGQAQLLPLPATAFAFRLVYNPTDDGYLLLWATVREREGQRSLDVDGALLSAGGTLQGEPFVVLGTTAHEEPWDVVYHPQRHEYLVSSRNALQRLTAQGALIGGPFEGAVGMIRLGVNLQQEDEYVVLARHGHLAMRLRVGPRCPTPTPTPPTEGTPTPSPTPLPEPAVVEWEGVIQEIRPLEDVARWTVGGRPVVVTRWTQVEEGLGRAEVGAEAWVMAQEQAPFDTPVANEIVILGAGTLTPTPTPTTTPVATATAQVYLPLLRRDASLLPDLVGGGGHFFPGFCYTPGIPWVTRVCVTNWGAAPAGPFTVQIGYEYHAMNWRVEGVDAGGQVCLEDGRIPLHEPVQVDVYDEVAESDETNNIGYVVVATAPPPCTSVPTATPTATPGTAKR